MSAAREWQLTRLDRRSKRVNEVGVDEFCFAVAGQDEPVFVLDWRLPGEPPEKQLARAESSARRFLDNELLVQEMESGKKGSGQDERETAKHGK